MQTISSLFDKEAWSVRVVKANQFLAKPLTMLIIIALLILFVFAYFVVDNKRIIRETNSSAENAVIAAEQARVAAENSQRININLERAVTDLKADNSQQTVILCNLILGGGVELIGEDAVEVERICQERILANSAAPMTPALVVAPAPTPPVPTAQTPGLTPVPDTPQTPPEEGGLSGFLKSLPLVGRLFE